MFRSALAIVGALVLGPAMPAAVRAAPSPLPSAVLAAQPSPWTVSPSVAPMGLAPNFFTAVSCAGTSFCLAVGHSDGPAAQPGLVELLGPSGWSPMAAPAVPGSTSTALRGVACPAAGSCVAVGDYLAGGSRSPLALTEVLSGGTWQAVPAAVPAGSQGTVLTSVSCSTSTSCVATGYYVSGGIERPLAEALVGGAWVSLDAPAPNGGNSLLSSVSCTTGTASTCTAVGYYTSAKHQRVLVEQMVPGTSSFATVAAADRGPSDNALTGVSCISGASCVAVGYYFNGHADQTLVEAQSQGVWKLVASPDRSVANNVLQSVSCTSASSCQAVGYYSDGQAPRALAEGSSGGTWKVEASPDRGPKGTSEVSNQLAAVACPTSSACRAVGWYEVTGARQLLAEVFGGRNWSLSAASGAQAPEARLQGVSCPAAGQCVAVGSQVGPQGVVQPLVETQSGGTWSIAAPPASLLPRGALAVVPGAPSGELDAVSCSGPGQCVAVGSFVGRSGNDQALIAVLANGSWSAVAGPGPGLAAAVTMQSVSCPATGACVAVGEYRNTGGATLPMVEAQLDGTWDLSYVPSVGTQHNQLLSVSCPASGTCVAVGSDSSRAGQSHTLVEELRNGYWSVVPSPDGRAANGTNVLAGVSCPAVGTCIAVGYSSSPTATTALVEEGTAAGWQSAASPAATAGGTHLLSVSCAGGQSCVATGYYVSRGTEQVLAAVTSGGGWSVAPASAPGQPSQLASAACASGACTAVGWYDNAQSQVPLVETAAAAPAGPRRTRTSMTAAPDPATVGQAVAFTATVSPAPTAGTVTFLDNGASLASCEGVAVAANGQAACTVVFSRPGAQLVQAVFSGGAGYDPSSSVIFDETVKAQPVGYWLATASGQVFATGAARHFGDAPEGSGRVVSMASTADGSGYWLVTAEGAVYAFGSARSFGDLPSLHVKVSDIVALAPTPNDGGYWLVGRDGGFFAFGDARFHGSLPGRHMHVHDIVGMVASGTAGYLLVGADGGVFNFGTARYHGSLPADHVRVRDIRTILMSAGGRGYMLVGADGGAFVFGQGVHFFGSLPGRHVRVHDIVGLALSPDAKGYLMAASNGNVYGFGDAKVEPRPTGLGAHRPVVAIAAL